MPKSNDLMMPRYNDSMPSNPRANPLFIVMVDGASWNRFKKGDSNLI